MVILAVIALEKIKATSHFAQGNTVTKPEVMAVQTEGVTRKSQAREDKLEEVTKGSKNSPPRKRLRNNT